MWTPLDLHLAAIIPMALIGSLGLTWLLSCTALKLAGQINPRFARQKPNLNAPAHVSIYLITTCITLLTIGVVGPAPAVFAIILFNIALVTLGWIDVRTGLLPDRLTLALLWLGLLINLEGALTPLPDAVLGAVAGYLWLWITFQIYFRITGKAGIGHGDFKLLAALGAWLGWMALPWVLLLASVSALFVAGVMKACGKLEPRQKISFGPYLAAGGIAMMLYVLT